MFVFRSSKTRNPGTGLSDATRTFQSRRHAMLRWVALQGQKAARWWQTQRLSAFLPLLGGIPPLASLLSKNEKPLCPMEVHRQVLFGSHCPCKAQPCAPHEFSLLSRLGRKPRPGLSERLATTERSKQVRLLFLQVGAGFVFQVLLS